MKIIFSRWSTNIGYSTKRFFPHFTLYTAAYHFNRYTTSIVECKVVKCVVKIRMGDFGESSLLYVPEFIIKDDEIMPWVWSNDAIADFYVILIFVPCLFYILSFPLQLIGYAMFWNLQLFHLLYLFLIIVFWMCWWIRC